MIREAEECFICTDFEFVLGRLRLLDELLQILPRPTAWQEWAV